MKPTSYATAKLIGELRRTQNDLKVAIESKNTQQKINEIKERIKRIHEELEISYNDQEYSTM